MAGVQFGLQSCIPVELMIFWIRPRCVRVTVFLTGSLTNLIPRKSVNVPSLVNCRPRFSKFVSRVFKVRFVRVGNSDVIHIENNHDCCFEEKSWIDGALFESLCSECFKDMLEPEPRSDR